MLHKIKDFRQDNDMGYVILYQEKKITIKAIIGIVDMTGK